MKKSFDAALFLESFISSMKFAIFDGKTGGGGITKNEISVIKEVIKERMARLLYRIAYCRYIIGGDEASVPYIETRGPYEPKFVEDMAWFIEQDKEVFEMYSENGILLKAHYLQHPHNTGKTVFIAHGYRSKSIDNGGWAKIFYDAGYNLFVPDATAHGMSEGDYINLGWLDRVANIEWIKKIDSINGGNSQIVLFGISMGASTVMMIAGQPDLPKSVIGLIEDSGFSSLDELTREFEKIISGYFPIEITPNIILTEEDLSDIVERIGDILFETQGFTLEDASATQQMKNSKIPVLFLHNIDDQLIPISMAEEVYDATNASHKSMVRFKVGGHIGGYFNYYPEYKRKIYEFVNEIEGKKGLTSIIRATQQWPGGDSNWNESGMLFPVEFNYSGVGNPPEDLQVIIETSDENAGEFEIISHGIVEFIDNIGFAQLVVKPKFIGDYNSIPVKLLSYIDDGYGVRERGDEITLQQEYNLIKVPTTLKEPNIPAANNGPINDLDVRNGVDIIISAGLNGFTVGEIINIFFNKYHWQYIISNREAGEQLLSFPVPEFMLENGAGECKYSLTSVTNNTSFSAIRLFAVNRIDLITNAILDEVEIQEAKVSGIINIASATAIPHAEFTDSFVHFVTDKGNQTRGITVTLKGYNARGEKITGATIAIGYDLNNFSRIVPIFPSSEDSIRFFNRIGVGQVSIIGSVETANGYYTSIKEKYYSVDVVAPGNDDIIIK